MKWNHFILSVPQLPDKGPELRPGLWTCLTLTLEQFLKYFYNHTTISFALTQFPTSHYNLHSNPQDKEAGILLKIQSREFVSETLLKVHETI